MDSAQTDKERRKSLARGGLATESNPLPSSKELAEVQGYSARTNSYTVITRGSGGNPKQPGGRQLKDIPRKVDTPGSVMPLSNGTVVVLEWSLGFPYIDGVLNVDANPGNVDSPSRQPPTVSGSAATNARPPDTSTEAAGGYFREPNMPTDILPGDWVHASPDGNRIGVMRGSYSFMDGGPENKAKVEVIGKRDLVRLTCEDFELNTGFGLLQMINSDGRCSLIFRAGADQLTESGGEEDLWTYKLDIGDTGEYFDMQICGPDGATKSKVYMSADGRVDVIATNGTSWVNGGEAPAHMEFASDFTKRVLGGVTELIEGVAKMKYNGSRDTTVSDTDSHTVGGNHTTSVNGNEYLNVAGNQEVTISGGSAIKAKPSNIAVNAQVLNGSYFMELGNPLAGASPLAKAGFTVAVNNGTVTLGENPELLAPPSTLAEVNLNTRNPRSVALGGTVGISKNPAIFGAVLYEPLLALIQAMMAIHDVHVHPPVSPTPMLMTPVLSSLLPTIRSQRVVIGA